MLVAAYDVLGQHVMITSICLKNFRSIKDLEMQFFSETINQNSPSTAASEGSSDAATAVLFYGANAQGKTTLLESIYFLLTGRSFRTAFADQLVGPLGDSLLVRGTLAFSSREDKDSVDHRIGIAKRRRSKLEVSLDGNSVRSAMVLARLLPIQIIDHQSMQLILGEPGIRRRFLDWGVFHVEPSYGSLLKKWQVALAQRNAALKGVGRNGNKAFLTQLEAWTEEYAGLSVQIAGMRQNYFRDFGKFVGEKRSNGLQESVVSNIVELHISDSDTLELTLKHGFSYCHSEPFYTSVQSFKSELGRKREFEIATGRTYAGPQRADISLQFQQQPAKEVMSRGQSKYGAALLLLHQVQHLRKIIGGGNAVILFDDLTAELDNERSFALLKDIANSCSQLFLTALAGREEELPDFLSRFAKQNGIKMFHLESGQVGSN